MRFGERLHNLREEYNVTQKQLGKYIGISARMISFYESGKHFPRDESILIKIADFFHVSLDYLLGHSELRDEKHLTNLCDSYKKLMVNDQKLASDYIRFLSIRDKLIDIEKQE